VGADKYTMTKESKQDSIQSSEKPRDENIGIMIYGSIKIRDIDTGKILVNTRA
jgi:hypothetical protein